VVTVILWLLYQQAKKPPVFIGMVKPLQARKYKSAKPETCYIVFTFVAWTVSELQSSKFITQHLLRLIAI